MLSLPRCPKTQEGGKKRASDILRIPLGGLWPDIKGKFFFYGGWKRAVAVNLLWTFDVQMSEDCGVLCCCVSPMQVTNSCNQSLFTVDPPLYLHNLSPLSHTRVSVWREGDPEWCWRVWTGENFTGRHTSINQTVIQIVQYRLLLHLFSMSCSPYYLYV